MAARCAKGTDVYRVWRVGTFGGRISITCAQILVISTGVVSQASSICHEVMPSSCRIVTRKNINIVQGDYAHLTLCLRIKQGLHAADSRVHMGHSDNVRLLRNIKVFLFFLLIYYFVCFAMDAIVAAVMQSVSLNY